MLKRYLLMILTAIASAGLILLRAINLGKKQEQAKQDKAALDAAIMRQELEDEINKSDDSTIRSTLSGWVRKRKE